MRGSRVSVGLLVVPANAGTRALAVGNHEGLPLARE